MTQHTTLAHSMFDHLRIERRDAHQRLLTLVADLTDDQLRWRFGHHAPSIGFHLWHLARWEDYDRSVIEATPQIWQARNLARAWGFPSVDLGEADTGTEMGDDASERLVLPSKPELLDYTQSAFAAVEDLLDQLPIETLLQPIQLAERSDRVLGVLFDGLVHDNRHLGMIEALRGQLDLRGTATR